MKAVLTVTLLFGALALGVVGAMTSPAPVKEVPGGTARTEQPRSPLAAPRGPAATYREGEDPQLVGDIDEWLRFSPMRVKMRGMWLNCGVIVARTTAPLIDYDGLESAAADIARKAEQFGDMWETVRDHNRNIATHAREGDWFNARYESQRLWTACTDCHVENWSPYTRGFEPESIETWFDKGYATEDAPYAFIRLTAPRAFIIEMFTMVRHLNIGAGDIEAHNTEGVMEATAGIHRLVNAHINHWRAIQRYAENIREAAARTVLTDIHLNYNKMAGHCAGCHAKYVHDGRLPLNPLPFPPADE